MDDSLDEPCAAFRADSGDLADHLARQRLGKISAFDLPNTGRQGAGWHDDRAALFGLLRRQHSAPVLDSTHVLGHVCTPCVYGNICV